ncbi:hypothetical protein [Methanobrevibacter sp. V14]|uniref:hypothetical protein n=1 Tax=Methanobrevibacter sp. V14 TaxID=3064280 RepID=UPI0027360E77|nr:hypothetical protein [Methanobrevibacter sp. V14]
MSSSIGNCIECPICGQEEGFICRLDGDFYTTGEYARIRNDYEIHGVTFNQKVDSVKDSLDINTIRILKALICDSNTFDYMTELEIIRVLDEINSQLSKIDNKTGTNRFQSINSYHSGDDAK